MRLAVRLITFGLLFALFAEAVWWCFVPNSALLQPVNAVLAVAAAIFAIPADRLAAAADQRKQTLMALRHEIVRNTGLLAEARQLALAPTYGQIYPRLAHSAMSPAILFSALNHGRDRRVLELALEWQSIAFDLNRRLEMTELRLCTGEPADRAELDLLRDIASRPDGHFAKAAAALVVLADAVNASMRRKRS
ncbi:hypothetical protein [Actinospica robiniae]|uniref:hypothetical protein n=1 Tax=Actinospica robiniae TaxID=304901 RepID=UPI0012FCF0C3|nr:hypothetical protein [Actinospica robiniae]